MGKVLVSAQETAFTVFIIIIFYHFPYFILNYIFRIYEIYLSKNFNLQFCTFVPMTCIYVEISPVYYASVLYVRASIYIGSSSQIVLNKLGVQNINL